MAGESLIAVKDAAGNWGYCDQSGALVIPCIYQPQMSLSIMNEIVEYPYADLSGMVVVKNQSGQKLVLDVYGNEIIPAGQYEDLAPARDGCVWAKQNGLWGLLQVQDYTENNADIILPDGCVAPDVTLSRIDSLCTYTTADHGLVMRKGPGTNYEKWIISPTVSSYGNAAIAAMCLTGLLYITMGFMVGSVMNTWLPLFIPPVNNK